MREVPQESFLILGPVELREEGVTIVGFTTVTPTSRGRVMIT